MLYLYFIISTLFIFLMTSLGALSTLFFKKDAKQDKMNFFLSFAGGIMLAASIFSLLLPALNHQEKNEIDNLFYAVVGIILGSLFILFFDIILTKTNKKDETSKYKKIFFAMTIHNIPEGMAIGLSFGIALLYGQDKAFIVPTILAFGIGIQNFPEGLATSLSMLNLTKSKKKSVILGILSGSVEIFASLLGFIFSLYLKKLLPLILSIGAGSMLFVVIDEIIINKEEGNQNKNNVAFLLGFLIMMILDIILG